jgi:hypothetical protein
MPQSARRLLYALLVALVSLGFASPAVAQSTSDTSSTPTLPVMLQSVSFATDAAEPLAQAGQPAAAPQRKHHEGIGIGIKGGFMTGGNLSSLSSSSPKTGYQISLFLGGNRPGVFGVATELTYVKRNANAVGVTTTSPNLQAFEVPFLFRINAGSSNLDRASFYVLFGPALDVNLTKFNSALIKNTTSFDLNLVISGGVEITRFIVEVRYNKGLKNIANNLSSSVPTNTHSVVFMIGVRFN